MKDICSEFIRADKLLEEFFTKNDKFKPRFVSLHKSMSTFIEETGLSQSVEINGLLLGYVLVNYFEDVMRLKEFHQVGHINNIKIVSYTAYWLLRQKPLQVRGADKKLAYINERFVLSYILSFLESKECGNILERTNNGLTAFAETLFYYLKYRALNPQSIEIMLIAFFAGQIYQETSVDLSGKLGKPDSDNCPGDSSSCS